MDAIVTTALVALSFVLIVTSNAAYFLMIARANRALPPERKIAYVFKHPFKASRVIYEYKLAHPKGKLHIISIISGVAGEFSS
jgi:hypothetical protein